VRLEKQHNFEIENKTNKLTEPFDEQAARRHRHHLTNY